MVKKTVDIEVNLGVSGGTPSTRRSSRALPPQRPFTLEQEQAARKKAAEALRKQQIREAAAQEKERLRAQRAAERQRKKDSAAFLGAQKVIDRRRRDRERAARAKAKEEERIAKARAQEAARLRSQQMQEAAQRERERLQSQKAAVKQRADDSQMFARAQRELDKRNKGRTRTPVTTLDVGTDTDRELLRRFKPLSQYPRTDKAHEATSKDRIERGVKEAEEIESRLRRKGSAAGIRGRGGLISGVATLPAYAAMGLATGHPGALAGGVMWAGKKIRDKGDEYAQMSRAKAAVDPKSVGAIEKFMPGFLKVLGTSVAAVGALQLSSINKRLEITQERARLELPLYQAQHVSGRNVRYFVPESRRAPGDPRAYQKAVRTDIGGGKQRYSRAYPAVDITDPADQSRRTMREQMPDLHLYRYMAETYGVDPQEAATMLRDFTVGAGVSNSFTRVTTDLLGQARVQGIGMGALTQVARLAGAGGGATYGAGAPGTPGDIGGVLSKIIGSAEGVGLRGSRIDEYMQRTAAATSQLAEKGFMMSVEGANELALAINKQGFYEASGTGALRTAQRLQSLGPRTAQELGAQMFAPLARGVMLAKGMEGAETLTDFFTNLSDLSKTRTGGLQTIDAFRRFLGDGEGALMGLIGAGESPATGTAALRTRELVGAPDMTVLRGEDIASSFGISRSLAGRQVTRLEEVTLETSQTLVSILDRLDKLILSFTSGDSVMFKMLNLLDEYLPMLTKAVERL